MEPLTGEVLNISNEFKSYNEFKASLDSDFQEASEKFVVIGYKLKVAKDTDILRESGYGNVYEFAEAEYSLDKSQVSRFTRINDEFSENGYSKRLREEYRKFGVAKLAIMLTLPAAVNEELTADYSKAEIQTIRAEIDEEQKRTDIEVMLEEKDSRQQDMDLFEKVLYQIGKDSPERYLELHAAVNEPMLDTDDKQVLRNAVDRMVDILAPAGEGTIIVRIPGERKQFLSIKGAEITPAVVDAWNGSRETCEWESFAEKMFRLTYNLDAKKSWEILYGEEFPEKKTEVAPVQPDSGEKQAPKKPSRVIVSKPQTPEKTKEDNSLTKGTEEKTTVQKEEDKGRDKNMEVAPVQPENREDTAPPADGGNDPEPADAASGTGAGDGSPQGDAADDAGITEEPPAAVLTEQIDGQMEIADFPESMPDNTATEQKQKAVAGYLIALKDNLDKVYILTERGEYQSAEERLEAVKGTILMIRDVSEVLDA